MIENIKIGKRDFALRYGKTYIMGILNVTPDSFSDGGRYNNIDSAIHHAIDMVNDGADIIDIGGESTRPNHVKISTKEEIERVVPYIKALKRECPDIPLSIDSYKSEVVKAAIDNGIDLVNDIWGLKWDSQLAPLIAHSNLPCVLMHNREDSLHYGDDFVGAVLDDLSKTLDIADNAGISRDKIILDPGVGFGKDLEQNLIITKHVDRLMELDTPVMLATSRKSMIGLTLNLPSDERVEGTIATSVLAVMKGINFVRVHDVKENARAIRMMEAILDSTK